MDKPRVILCRTQVGMGTDGLVTLIQAAPTISVSVLLGREALIRALELGHYSVLIGQAGAHSDSDCERYHSIRSDMAIIIIDVDGEETMVRLRDVGRDVLIKLIDAVSNIRRGLPVERSPVHFVKKEEIERIAASRVVGASTLKYADPTLHLDDVRRWLDLSFGFRLAIMARDEPDAGRKAIRGWGLDLAQARALLGEEFANTEPDCETACKIDPLSGVIGIQN